MFPIAATVLPHSPRHVGIRQQEHDMAAVLSILGGFAGFVAACVALAIFSAPALTALLIWAGTGCAVVVLGLARALAPLPRAANMAAQELA
jgi:uncharacterized membrane protein YjfL (UPF0719 family)